MTAVRYLEYTIMRVRPDQIVVFVGDGAPKGIFSNWTSAIRWVEEREGKSGLAELLIPKED